MFMDLLVMNTTFTNVCSNEIQHDLLIMIEGVVSDFMKGFVTADRWFERKLIGKDRTCQNLTSQHSIDGGKKGGLTYKTPNSELFLKKHKLNYFNVSVVLF